jgi:L-lactate dehydrogenase complex protein LldG
MEIIGKSNISYTEKFEDPKAIKSAISSCEFLIARYGSVMVSSALPGGRRVFSFPEIHIVIASEKQLLMEIEEGFAGIQQKYGDELPSQIINISGPSRTADIEKTLILGAHGPKQLIVFVLKSL